VLFLPEPVTLEADPYMAIQGCQIFLCRYIIPKIYQMTTKYSKDNKIFQMTTKYSKRQQNISNDHKIFQMTTKYSKWL
jgi:hypothetical protein